MNGNLMYNFFLTIITISKIHYGRKIIPRKQKINLYQLQYNIN